MAASHWPGSVWRAAETSSVQTPGPGAPLLLPSRTLAHHRLLSIHQPDQTNMLKRVTTILPITFEFHIFFMEIRIESHNWVRASGWVPAGDCTKESISQWFWTQASSVCILFQSPGLLHQHLHCQLQHNFRSGFSRLGWHPSSTSYLCQSPQGYICTWRPIFEDLRLSASWLWEELIAGHLSRRICSDCK